MNDPDIRPAAEPQDVRYDIGGWISGPCLGPPTRPEGTVSTDEPTREDIKRAYPDWETWVGTDQLPHGRRTEGAALTARGEDWMDLMDQIRRAEVMLEETRPAGWQEPSP